MLDMIDELEAMEHTREKRLRPLTFAQFTQNPLYGGFVRGNN